MSTMNLITRFAVLATVSTGTAAAALLFPNPSLVAGTPGQTVGFGFSFVNNIIFDDAVLTISDFQPTAAGLTYTDLISSNFIVVDQLSGYGTAYDPSTGAGIGEVFIEPGTPPGPIDATITLFFDLYLHN